MSRNPDAGAEAVDATLPVIDANDSFAVVTGWFVEHGAAVEEGDPLLSVETTKTLLDIESPASGFVECCAVVGGSVENGGLLARIHPRSDVPKATSAGWSGSVTDSTSTGRPATDAARALALTATIDLASVPGQGLLTEAQVRSYLDRPSPSDRNEEKTLAVRPTRQLALSEAMRRAGAITIPSFLSTSVETGPTQKFIDEYGRAERIPISETDAILLATAMALKCHPRLNGWQDGTNAYLHPTVNIALAIEAVDGGLAAPILENADTLSLRDIAHWRIAEQRTVNERRRQTLQVAEATFSLSNLASYGIEGFVPNLLPRQAGTLGIGARSKQGGNRWVLGLSFDHACVNGAYAAWFLRTLIEILSSPDALT